MSTIKIHNLSDIETAATEFIAKTENKKIFAIYGKMGAGKTTFIKEVCQQLGVVSEVTSPTFSIVNEYTTNADDTIFHFDLYRLKDLNELLDTGFEEYLYSQNIIFIEWPEIAEKVLPESTLKVLIKVDEKNIRNLNF